jgi:hypothetical protein
MIRIILSFSAQFAHFSAHSARVGAPTPGWHASWGGAQHAWPGTAFPSGPGSMAALPVPGAKNAGAAAENRQTPTAKLIFFVPTLEALVCAV